MLIIEDWGLWGLVVSGFLSATLLPGSSEAMLVYAAHERWAMPATIWTLATLGNTAGGLTNWLLGAWVVTHWPRFAPAKSRQQTAIAWLQRWGAPVLLLSWLPVIGDLLCLVAGWLGFGFARSLLFIFLGKGFRYALLLAAVSSLLAD